MHNVKRVISRESLSLTSACTVVDSAPRSKREAAWLGLGLGRVRVRLRLRLRVRLRLRLRLRLRVRKREATAQHEGGLGRSREI